MKKYECTKLERQFLDELYSMQDGEQAANGVVHFLSHSKVSWKNGFHFSILTHVFKANVRELFK